MRRILLPYFWSVMHTVLSREMNLSCQIILLLLLQITIWCSRFEYYSEKLLC